ncbi:GNAT family N-acetyltransferase [Streptomyces sp. NPDC005438]|uniref:GNAT family N-acetyltransferase n=1 Tax=Streptomyces sp. NPDC005438 TaxID=3156880 RepID=UPI0033BA15BB
MPARVELPCGLRLRRWTPADRDTVREVFAEPLMEWQADQPVNDAASAAGWLTRRILQWESDTAYSYAVTDAQDEVLGCVAVSAIDRRHDCGWVSYWTRGQARGRAVASRACAALSELAFTEAALYRLELGHRVDNPASCRVALRAGYAVEGLQRRKLRYGEARYDVETHARLATDPVPAPGRSGVRSS